jgi:hypothetical protein
MMRRPRPRATPAALALAAAALLPATAAAATPDAWAAMRAEAARLCTEAARQVLGPGGRVSVVVSPQGTEAHALARVTHVVGKRSAVHVCVMDKRTRAASFDPAPIDSWRSAG